MSTYIYCPACGEDTKNNLVVNISPGDLLEKWECPKCGTVFTIRVEFFEQEQGEDDGEDE